ncbi:MAG: ABC transporter permease subunit/CPBP intramembrane protease [Pseudomonadota bacterium]
MRTPPVWLVYRKELLETLRDRRTLIVMVLLPLCLYPLLAVILSQWIGVQQSARIAEPSRVGIPFSSPQWPDLENTLAENKRIKLIRVDQPSAAKEGIVDLVLVVPPDFQRTLEVGESVSVELVFDETNDRSALAHKRVHGALTLFAEELLAERLERQEFPFSFAQPLLIDDQNIATSRERGAHLLATMLPLLLVLMVLLGAFYPAIDLTAGEKERGTLETLLTVPVPRFSLIMGKFLVVTTIATITGLLNLGSISLTVALGLRTLVQNPDLITKIPWGAVLLTTIAILPTALFFSALMVAVAALARSFKAAQTLLTPVYLVCMLPAMLALLPGMHLNTITALLPAMNIALLTREIITGHATISLTALSLLSTCLYGLLALATAARIYNSERLLFAPDSANKHAPNSKSTKIDPVQVGILLLAVTTLLLLVGQPLQAYNFFWGIVITEWGLIGFPVILLLRTANLAPKSILSLFPARRTVILGAIITGLTGWYLVAVLVQTVQERFLPIPPEVIEGMQNLLFSPGRKLWLDLFALAISPAICEELLFRGALLHASRDSLKPWAVVLLNAVLFGLFHLSIYRFFPTALLGAVLALIVLRTGSIYPAMVFHFLNNGAAILIGRLAGEAYTKVEQEIAMDPVGIVAVSAIFVGGLFLVLRKKNQAHPTEKIV